MFHRCLNRRRRHWILEKPSAQFYDLKIEPLNIDLEANLALELAEIPVPELDSEVLGLSDNATKGDSENETDGFEDIPLDSDTEGESESYFDAVREFTYPPLPS